MDEKPNLILILEDDAGLRRAIERLLRLSGYGTRSFRSVEDSGVSQWAATACCLVIDVQLPGLSGPAFYHGLSAPRPPAVFITAYDGVATRNAVESAGGHTLLAKPFLGEALLDAIQQAIRRGP